MERGGEGCVFFSRNASLVQQMRSAAVVGAHNELKMEKQN